MIERADHEQAGGTAEPERQDVVGRFPIEVVVGVHHPFGPVGRARRVHQAEQVLRPSVGPGRPVCSRAQAARVPLRIRIDEHDRRRAPRVRRKLRIGEQQQFVPLKQTGQTAAVGVVYQRFFGRKFSGLITIRVASASAKRPAAVDAVLLH